MALEVFINKADNHHENVQFHRIVKHLIPFFEQQKWKGILIGNPFNEDYPRFRADAILYYTNGLIIIDFKDYKGEMLMPLDDEEFGKIPWYINVSNGEKIKIDAGENHTNPFKQLNRYRGVMKSIIEDDTLMRYILDKNRTCALNIFSGPITKNRETSRKVPYYQLCDELQLHNFLEHYTSVNTFDNGLAQKFKALFPAEVWQDYEIDEKSYFNNATTSLKFIDEGLKPILEDFYKNTDSGVLVLESMDLNTRMQWLETVNKYVVNEVHLDTEAWCHSSRIANKLNRKTEIPIFSLYTVIYGGKAKITEIEVDESVEIDEEEISQEVIGLKSAKDIDENATIIIPEAHLVSRSLHQSDLIRFGSGRLLEDLFSFLNLENTNRKLIFIGDPYMLSYGAIEDCALNIDTLNEIIPNSNVLSYRQQKVNEPNKNELYKLRVSLGNSIDQQLFNLLNYKFENSLLETNKEDSIVHFKNWFTKIPQDEPKNTILFFSKKDARTTNLWIKKNVVRNGKALAKDDVLVLNNNITIPDDTGLGVPTKAVNGSYFLVTEVLNHEPKIITNRKKGFVAQLDFRHLKVKLLGNPANQEATVIILENYLEGIEELSREDQIAVKIFINQELARYRKEYPFEKSKEWRDLQFHKEYKNLTESIRVWHKAYDSGEKILKKDLKALEKEKTKIEKEFKNIYSLNLMLQLRKSNPYVNMAFVNYAWAITVHKSVGSQFENVILKATQQENAGITNESYFRWLYSGLTASKKVAHILNPQYINPFHDVQIIDDNELEFGISLNLNTVNLNYENEEIPKDIQELIPGSFNHTAALVIHKLNIELQHLTIVSIIKNNDYLSKCVFKNSENKELLIAINNKGNQEVSSVRIERGIQDLHDEVLSAIDTLFEIERGKLFPSDFRGEIYKKWISKLAENDVKLFLLECHNNEDRLAVTQDKNLVKFNLRYTTGGRNRGFFTALEVKEKSCEDLVELTKQLVNEY